ncbi:LPXTG cell wall anchor domain-containing protein [Lentzea sp. NPDC051213]|uniref:LPXTG cell wall anchor domain-containing protein n=1 Tax=Lentzea sp. NPDC051213 TaxID=3364126 RepID=UPI00378BE014
MRLTPLTSAGLLGAAAVATLALATTAFADEPTTDDKRAVPFLKNVDINHPEACTVGGLTGTPIHPDKFTYTGGDNQQYLDITALPAGVTVTGVLVKGGDKFNVYLADKLGDALPWDDLRSPFNNGGQLPQISHWFGCGVVEEQPPSSTPSSSTSTSTSTVTHTSTPTSTPTSSSSEVAPTTTTTVAPMPVADVDDLAATGFGSAWLVGLGAALLAAGAAVLLVLRRRSA